MFDTEVVAKYLLKKTSVGCYIAILALASIYWNSSVIYLYVAGNNEFFAPLHIERSYQLEVSMPWDDDSVRDWFKAVRIVDEKDAQLRVDAEDLQLVQIVGSKYQCLHDCYRYCNNSLPVDLNTALTGVYDSTKIGASRKVFNHGCAKLMVAAEKMVFAKQGKKQTSLASTPYFPKDQWTARLKQYAQENNCKPGVFESYNLGIKEECESLLKRQNKSEMYFWKDPGTFGGQGIKVQTILEKKASALMECPVQDLFAEKYASPLWLLNKKKWDNRVLVFVLSFKPLVVYMRPGYIHASLFNFDIRSSKKPVHVTNGHVQQPYCKGCSTEEWKKFIKPYSNVLADLCKNENNQTCQEKVDLLTHRQIRSVVQLILSSRDMLKVKKDKHNRNLHGMFGLDMLATSDLRWYILDVNRYPGWRSGPSHLVKDNYRANLEATAMLGDYLFERRMNRSSFAGSSRFWLEIYNENNVPASPYLQSGECDVGPAS